MSKFVEDINQKAKESELTQSHEQQIKFEKQLLAQKFEAALKGKELAEKNARLPKLSITKFNGKQHDWVRFSGQFKAMVDSQNVPAIMHPWSCERRLCSRGPSNKNKQARTAHLGQSELWKAHRGASALAWYRYVCVMSVLSLCRGIVHLLLGANEYAKIRTSNQSRIGRLGEPVA